MRRSGAYAFDESSYRSSRYQGINAYTYTRPSLSVSYSDSMQLLIYLFAFESQVENVLKHKGRYKLCDFGSATTKPIKAESVREINAADDLIQRHTTMMYRSPEMVDLYQRKLINEKVDIWV